MAKTRHCGAEFVTLSNSHNNSTISFAVHLTLKSTDTGNISRHVSTQKTLRERINDSTKNHAQNS